MDRLCERPGCSERASVAYGMRPEDLVFWLDALPDGTAGAGGVLCRRHADAMVVPRGWTLDDLRDPDLHLFRPPAPLPPPAAPRHRRRSSNGSRPTAEQLDFAASGGESADEVTHQAAHVASDGEGHIEADRSSPVVVTDAPAPWTPEFDEADDLGGLLAARSPLLSRAFRTAERGD